LGAHALRVREAQGVADQTARHGGALLGLGDARFCCLDAAGQRGGLGGHGVPDAGFLFHVSHGLA
jgi:hypothetical protein